MLEVFNNLFMSIAEQMGVVAAEHRLLGEHQGAARLLLRGVRTMTARWSPTRRTCRCISAPWTARLKPSSARTEGSIRPGDVYAINAPYNGGTHLPDITVCTPVFDDTKKAILFWVASRGHHADVGGISPGLDVAECHHDRAGRRPVRQFQADRPRPVPREGA